MSVLSKIIPKDRSERDYDGFSPDEIYEMGWNDLKSKMEEMDIVPVVRCKDCKYRPKKDGYFNDFCPCATTGDPYLDWIPEDDWYCASGEKVEQ